MSTQEVTLTFLLERQKTESLKKKSKKKAVEDEEANKPAANAKMRLQNMIQSMNPMAQMNSGKQMRGVNSLLQRNSENKLNPRSE